MGRELGVNMSDKEALKGMIMLMVEPMNHATEAIWRTLMEDDGKDEAIERFRQSLENLKGSLA
jgi:hypothetical protein